MFSYFYYQVALIVLLEEALRVLEEVAPAPKAAFF
jgi:hypothetical protein